MKLDAAELSREQRAESVKSAPRVHDPGAPASAGRASRAPVAFLGIDARSTARVLGVHEGAPKNATCGTAMLADLEARRVRTDRTTLVVTLEAVA